MPGSAEYALAAEEYAGLLEALLESSDEAMDSVLAGGCLISVFESVGRWLFRVVFTLPLVFVAAAAALRFGPLSMMALLSYASVFASLFVVVVAQRLLGKADRALDGKFNRGACAELVARIERGEAGLPTGHVRAEWDERGLVVEGGAVRVRVGWEESVRVVRSGEWVALVPIVGVGLPDVGRVAAVPASVYAEIERGAAILDEG